MKGRGLEAIQGCGSRSRVGWGLEQGWGLLTWTLVISKSLKPLQTVISAIPMQGIVASVCKTLWGSC